MVFNCKIRRRVIGATGLLAMVVVLASTLLSCATDRFALEETVSDCLTVCGLACVCALNAPVIVAGTAGCLLGGCTRCAEGDSAMVDDDEVVRSEPPPPTKLAEEQRDRAEMDY